MTPSAVPEVEVFVPRTTHDEGVSETYFPRVPTEEPRGLVPSTIVVPEMIQRESTSSVSLPGPRVVTPVAEDPFSDPVAPISIPVMEPEVIQAEPAITYSATFVADNNITDGHMFPPGAEFVKSWLVLNSGDVAWPESTVLAFVGGERLATDSHIVPSTYAVGRVEPGAEVDVHALDMKAPEDAGRYVSHWRLQDGYGLSFGDQLWCE